MSKELLKQTAEKMIEVLARTAGQGIFPDKLAMALFGDHARSIELLAVAEHFRNWFSVNNASGKIFLTTEGVMHAASKKKSTPGSSIHPPPDPVATYGGFNLESALRAVKNYRHQLEPVILNISSGTQIERVTATRYLYSFKVDSIADDFHPTDDTPMTFKPKASGNHYSGYISGYSDDKGTIFATLDCQMNWDECAGTMIIENQKFWYAIEETLSNMKTLPESFARFLGTQVSGNSSRITTFDDLMAALKPLGPVWQKFIWGPPGAGKTYLIAKFIAHSLLHSPAKRILVTAPSNFAVDAIIRELLKIPEMNPFLDQRLVIRFGYPRDEQILGEPRISGSDEYFEIKKQIQDLIAERAKKTKLSDQEKASYGANIKARLQELNTRLRTDLNDATVVATTITSALLPNSPIMQDQIWSTIVVDELSMVSTVCLLPFLKAAKESLLLCGDPKQLAPIYQWSQPYKDISAEHWIKLNAFDFAGLSHREGHKGIVREDARILKIQKQRRCAKPIWDLVSSLYDDVESIENLESNSRVTNLYPKPGQHVVLLDTSHIISLGQIESERMSPEQVEARAHKFASSCVKKGSSWINPSSALLAIDVVKGILSQRGDLQIAIVTPYRAQVRLLKKMLDLEFPDQPSGDRKVQIGTIHAFQGSEADVVVVDICDGPPRTKPGALLMDDSGERLLNVAITRARGKLIVIGNLDWLKKQSIYQDKFAWKTFFEFSADKTICRVVVSHQPDDAPDYSDPSQITSPPHKRLWQEMENSKSEIPPFMNEYRIRDPENNEIVSRVDIAIPSQRIAIYVDGQVHREQDVWQKDMRTRRRLTELGWKYLVFSGSEALSNATNCVLQILLLLKKTA